MAIEIDYNGTLTYSDAIDTLTEDFASEKELCDYIEQNIKMFCRDVLGSQYIDHKRECRFDRGRGNSGLRIDFKITTNNGDFYIECKCPSQDAQAYIGIGQCLAYHTTLKSRGDNFNKVVLLTSKLSALSVNMILEFNLPIDFVFFSKDKYARLIQNGH